MCFFLWECLYKRKAEVKRRCLHWREKEQNMLNLNFLHKNGNFSLREMLTTGKNVMVYKVWWWDKAPFIFSREIINLLGHSILVWDGDLRNLEYGPVFCAGGLGIWGLSVSIGGRKRDSLEASILAWKKQSSEFLIFIVLWIWIASIYGLPCYWNFLCGLLVWYKYKWYLWGKENLQRHAF